MSLEVVHVDFGCLCRVTMGSCFSALVVLTIRRVPRREPVARQPGFGFVCLLPGTQSLAHLRRTTSRVVSRVIGSRLGLVAFFLGRWLRRLASGGLGGADGAETSDEVPVRGGRPAPHCSSIGAAARPGDQLRGAPEPEAPLPSW